MKQFTYVYVNKVSGVVEHVQTSDAPITEINIKPSNLADLEIHEIEGDRIGPSGSKFIRARDFIEGLERKPDLSIDFKPGHSMRGRISLTKISKF